MSPIRTLAFVINDDKVGAHALEQDLSAIARSCGVNYKRTSRLTLPNGYLTGMDACCVIGGDGTLLGVAAEAARARVPIIGINRGSLGFLTTFSADQARTHFDKLLKGKFKTENRALLECSVGLKRSDLALNDVLVKSATNSRLVRLEVYANEELVTDYLCDGIIFSTPTGSTAYTLSAGGPIIHPTSEVIAMTPICPHTLSNRSIIFNQSVKLRVKNCSSNTNLLVAIDGQRNLKVTKDSQVHISIAKKYLTLAHQSDYQHFSVVREKLKWSGGFSDVKH
jgi:NAD+ kinase